MNVKLIVGIVLFVIGLATAVIGIASVGQVEPPEQTMIVEENKSLHLSETMGQMALPFIAALSLAIGGLLIGISVGDWKNPRTTTKQGDEVVNPEGYHKMKHV